MRNGVMYCPLSAPYDERISKKFTETMCKKYRHFDLPCDHLNMIQLFGWEDSFIFGMKAFDGLPIFVIVYATVSVQVKMRT